MTVLVTGASGLLGRLVVDTLQSRGVPARGTGRGDAPPGSVGGWRRADLSSAAGLAEAVAGVSAVVHCASNPLSPDNDVRALDNLVAALRPEAGYIVYVGIAGIEDASQVLPYYRVKLTCEERLINSGLPYTICRATQFHPFVERILGSLGWGPIQLCPALRLQPVDPRFVAERLAAHATSGPQGRSVDVCGPELLSTDDLVEPWLRAHQLHRLRVPFARIGPIAAFTRLSPANGDPGGVSWQDWLNKNNRAEGVYTSAPAAYGIARSKLP